MINHHSNTTDGGSVVGIPIVEKPTLYGSLMQMVDILACHARYTGSSPVGVAISHSYKDKARSFTCNEPVYLPPKEKIVV